MDTQKVTKLQDAAEKPIMEILWGVHVGPFFIVAIMGSSEKGYEDPLSSRDSLGLYSDPSTILTPKVLNKDNVRQTPGLL